MAKGPRKAKSKEESPLLAALRFISVAQKEAGPLPQQHCHIINGAIVATDGILSAGILYPEPLPPVAPNTFKLIQALSTSRGPVTLTQLGHNITVKSDKLQAVIQGLDPLGLTAIQPDPPAHPLNDNFRLAGKIAGALTKEGAQVVQYASLLTRNGSLVGTNGNAIIEAYHGTPTPPGLILPKQFFDTLAKIAKPIAKFGFSPSTLTIFFDDNSWVKTQLYTDTTWPDVETFLKLTESMKPGELPKEFFAAIAAVAPFADDSRVYFGPGNVSSHPTTAGDIGARHYLKGSPDGLAVNFKHVAELAEHIAEIDFATDDRAILFRGKNEAVFIRGLISKMTRPASNSGVAPEPKTEPAPPVDNAAAQTARDLDDNIPF